MKTTHWKNRTLSIVVLCVLTLAIIQFYLSPILIFAAVLWGFSTVVGMIRGIRNAPRERWQVTSTRVVSLIAYVILCSLIFAACIVCGLLTSVLSAAAMAVIIVFTMAVVGPLSLPLNSSPSA